MIFFTAENLNENALSNCRYSKNICIQLRLRYRQGNSGNLFDKQVIQICPDLAVCYCALSCRSYGL